MKKKILMWSSIMVAVSTIAFVLLLIFTFDMSSWDGIAHYAEIFKPSFLYTVYPSIALAISFLIFNVGVYFYADENRRVCAHLAMNFGIVYATISLSNYFIQLISIMPSVLAKKLEGLDILVSGNPNSIFFALMASYFLMCISYFFTSLVFANQKIRFWLQLGSVGCVILFIIGGITSISVVMLRGALCWIVGTIVGTCLIALEVKQGS